MTMYPQPRDNEIREQREREIEQERREEASLINDGPIARPLRHPVQPKPTYEQLEALVAELREWRDTFSLLGGTPGIAWEFYKGLESVKIATEALAVELREALQMANPFVPCHEHSETRKLVEAALARTPAPSSNRSASPSGGRANGTGSFNPRAREGATPPASP
ncbi:hypothetical protein OPIT5_04005 [Opitutaceae bacterium TAV5]|nr:hypothetical protein OPIT5_04005 [Opitutaceae bacterium TAV5]